MKMICAPSQVIREGSDLNQHGQAGRQEQASSSSPATFHGVLFAAAALAKTPTTVMPHTTTIETIDFLSIIRFMIFLALKRCIFSGDSNPATGAVNTKTADGKARFNPPQAQVNTL